MKDVLQSEEATIKVGEVEITYDTFGNPSNPPILLIMGLGTQMIFWNEDFCKELARRGYWVVRFDNRDVGLSSKFDEAGIPDVMGMIQSAQTGDTIEEVPYTLLDMANDAIGLLNGLKIKSAHIIGVSMGGMIAQTIAIHYPERVKTLTSIMSSTGDPELPPPEPDALAVIVTPPPSDRTEYIEQSVQSWRVLNGSKYPLDEEYIRKYSARAFDRSYYPVGTTRQLAAILASGSRKEALKSVNLPTLVIHGDADPLVPIEAGKDTAKSVPGAKFVVIEGMGHNIPVQVAPHIIDAIVEHTK